MTTALDVLTTTFGYDSFRGDQAAIVDHVVAGGDAVVLMPTGGGKSLCYQIPALVREGTGIVVSPLIALMQDQVDALRELGVRAAFLNSSLTAAEQREVARRYLAGDLDLIYVSPERLALEGTRRMLSEGRIALIAIDEAHCVSQWGHDFRPDYLTLGELAQLWPGVPRLALTATATQATRRELVERLHLEGAKLFVSSFDRPNIRYRIEPKNAVRQQLVRFIREEHPGEAGIVYALSRASVDEIAQVLAGNGIAARPYHAGMDAESRRETQAWFLREDGAVVVATIAFGMGIDKPDVRFVAHVDLPKSVEGYYQETGRAGRDGLPSDAWLAYGLADVVQQRRLIETSAGDAAFRRQATLHLDAMLALCETPECRRVNLLGYFGEQTGPCGNCDTCLAPPETFDGTTAAQKLLSTIWRLDKERRQHFGAGQLIDILQGKDTDRIRRFGHDQLSTYGVGTELSDTQWRSVVRQLIAAELIGVSADGYGTLRLTPASADVLRGDKEVRLRTDVVMAAPAKARRKKSRLAEDEPPMTDSDEALFERLRAWRAETAREHGLPAYVIFHDATLRAVARRRPAALADLDGISGIGVRKLEAYGQSLIDVVQAAESGRAADDGGRAEPSPASSLNAAPPSPVGAAPASPPAARVAEPAARVAAPSAEFDDGWVPPDEPLPDDFGLPDDFDRR